MSIISLLRFEATPALKRGYTLTAFEHLRERPSRGKKEYFYSSCHPSSTRYAGIQNLHRRFRNQNTRFRAEV